MPEPLTTLHRCKRCEAIADPFDPLWRFSQATGLAEHVHDGIRVSCDEPVPVFSAGDMQAALDEAAREAAAADEFEVQISFSMSREVELAEALREIYVEANEGTDDAHRRLVNIMKIVAGLGLMDGSPRSHEVVPLGTQEALVELRAAVGQLPIKGPKNEQRTRVYAALEAADALVEGVEPARSRETEPLPDCSCAMTEASANSCPIHGLESNEETLAAWNAAREVEGVERTPTPGATIAEAESRWSGRCYRCGEIIDPDLSGEYLDTPGRGFAHVDACPEPDDVESSPSGITDEIVEAAALALAGPSPFTGGEVGEWPEAHHRAHAREVLAAALELQGGERTHTLVPNEHAKAAADDLHNYSLESDSLTGEQVDRIQHLSLALAAAARGEHPVQWPGDDTGRKREPNV